MDTNSNSTARMATVYSRRRKVYMHASSQTTDGVWILTEPIVSLDGRATDEEIGSAVQATLKQSRVGIPHPTNWTGLLAPLLNAAGVRSWSKFAETATCVCLELQDGKLVAIPTKNRGPANGFEHEPGKSATLNTNDAADIGAGVRRLFQQAIT